jgi:hypothetical protein
VDYSYGKKPEGTYGADADINVALSIINGVNGGHKKNYDNGVIQVCEESDNTDVKPGDLCVCGSALSLCLSAQAAVVCWHWLCCVAGHCLCVLLGGLRPPWCAVACFLPPLSHQGPLPSPALGCSNKHFFPIHT